MSELVLDGYLSNTSHMPFMVSGEMISKLNLMPDDDGYILRYNIFPMELGHLYLPKLTISDICVQSVYLIKDFTRKIHITSQ
jgi:hypothetical protein